ncbi:MAG: hypothetical protein JNL82_07010 [Myxococcales bacterium]|nr:hypothetical protein [Myxococcales bacterium]
MTEPDEIGDLLRDCYRIFGMPDEGPPLGLNVTKMIGGSVPATELEDIRTAIADNDGCQQVQRCRVLLEDLATRLTGEELLQELSRTPLACAQGVDELSNGVFWFALAGRLDTRKNGLPTTPFDEAINRPLPLKVRMSVHGSLVLRMYVALVYMREGYLNKMIHESSRARGQCAGQVKKLLNGHYVRRIRNSLSHGTFSPGIAGIVFRDENRVIVATPGFLNWLCTWLSMIQLQALAACSRGEDTRRISGQESEDR